MSSPLEQAIDSVLALVDDYKAASDHWHATPGNLIAWNTPAPATLPRFDVRQFEALSRIVFVEACKVGLENKIPPKDVSAFNPGASPPSFIGQTNLPGCFLLDGRFEPMAIRGWRDAMLTLRALTEEFTGKSAAVSGETPPAESTATADDPTAYRPMKEFIDDQFPTHKSIHKCLNSNPSIRKRRPKGKNGQPIMNRLEIHAGDWQRFKRLRSGGDPLDQPAEMVDAAIEAAGRQADIRKLKAGE
jgi:hypothetical protein